MNNDPKEPKLLDHEADGIRELAKRGHVSCKVSGMLTEVRGETWNLDLLRPYFDTVYEAFGPQRGRHHAHGGSQQKKMSTIHGPGLPFQFICRTKSRIVRPAHAAPPNVNRVQPP